MENLCTYLELHLQVTHVLIVKFTRAANAISMSVQLTCQILDLPSLNSANQLFDRLKINLENKLPGERLKVGVGYTIGDGTRSTV